MKKRNKKYTPRATAIPSMFLTHTVLDSLPNLALALYGQTIAFCERPNPEASYNLSRMLACVAGGMNFMSQGAPIRERRDPASLAICGAIDRLEAVVHRFEQTGELTVREEEKQAFMAGAARLDEVLQCMPLACWLRAEKEADRWLVESQEPAEATA